MRISLLRNSRGFTLIEVMIVLVIMSTLVVLSSQNIQQGIKNKIKLQSQVDDMAQVRDALKVMERDINLAFHYSDLETELKAIVKKKRDELCKVTTTTQPGTVSSPGTNPQAKPGCNPNDPTDPLNKKSESRVDPSTHLLGKENEIYFPTMNTSRLNEGVAQADFIKVGYQIQSCKKPGQEKESGNCLVRRSSHLVEGDISKGGENVVLLENVTEFKLRYFGKGRQDWNTEWDSLKGDGIAKNRFPDAVEVSLKIEKGDTDQKKKISMQIVVPIRFNNNTYQDAQNNAGRAAQAGGAGGPGGIPNNGFLQPAPPPGQTSGGN